MKRLIKFLFKVVMAIIITVAAMNLIVLLTTTGQVITIDEAKDKNADCVLVLGAAVWGNDPSPMLKKRIDKGIEVLNSTQTECILMTGDGRESNYNEPETMSRYAVQQGVDQENIVQDPYGIRTYDSLWRAKYVLGYESVIIVTQSYHLNRAIYIARSLGLEVYGIACDDSILSAGWYNTARETGARCKDFIWCLFKIDPAYTD
ncbi:MAG: YdcF family protein [Erysipelotrichaceae bacterium]|nr:YdcF family protein [Erysipelotrichaceae bacterium]